MQGFPAQVSAGQSSHAPRQTTQPSNLPGHCWPSSRTGEAPVWGDSPFLCAPHTIHPSPQTHLERDLTIYWEKTFIKIFPSTFQRSLHGQWRHHLSHLYNKKLQKDIVMAGENPDPFPCPSPWLQVPAVWHRFFSMVFQPHPLSSLAGRCLCPAGGPWKAPLQLQGHTLSKKHSRHHSSAKHHPGVRKNRCPQLAMLALLSSNPCSMPVVYLWTQAKRVLNLNTFK